MICLFLCILISIFRSQFCVHKHVLLQVARTINNMQQQIQQHQRQLAQALLMKQQQQQPPPSHPGLHPSIGKSALDTFPSHPQVSSLSVSDLQTKEPQSSPNSFSPYPICELPTLSIIVCLVFRLVKIQMFFLTQFPQSQKICKSHGNFCKEYIFHVYLCFEMFHQLDIAVR